MAKKKDTTTESGAAKQDDSGLLFAEFIEYGEEVTTVTFHGEKFDIPALRSDWPTKGMQKLQRAQFADAVELILGVEQWDRFNALFPKLSQFWEFFPMFAEATGFARLGGAAEDDTAADDSSSED